MHNKGQLGKILTSFPVIISVFIIMAAFIVLSAGSKLALRPNSPESSVPSYVTNDLSLRSEGNVEMSIVANVIERKVPLLYEGYGYNNIAQDIGKEVKIEEERCFIFFRSDKELKNWDEVHNYIYSLAYDDIIGLYGSYLSGIYSDFPKNMNDNIEKYYNKGFIQKGLVDEDYIYYYYGKCVEEEK